MVKMTNTEKAIAILQATDDGNKLSPAHLYLVEMACNNLLNAAGEQAFAKLTEDVMSGHYARPWLFGIEFLTREHGGYIAWRSVVIEHYSFHDEDRERVAATRLAESCLSLEARGFPVCGRTVGGFSPFQDAPAGTPWVTAMLHYYTVFEDGGKCKWLIVGRESAPESHALAIAVVNGDVQRRYAFSDQCNFGTYLMFHELQREGMLSTQKPLHTYAGFIAAMEEAGITPEIVESAMAAPVYRQAA